MAKRKYASAAAPPQPPPKKSKNASASASASAAPPPQALMTHLERYLAAPHSVQLPRSVQLPLHCSPVYAVLWGKNLNDPLRKQSTHGLWQNPKNTNAAVIDPSSGDEPCFGPELQTILRRIMPSLNGNGDPTKDFKFWQHEWMDHGRFFAVTLEDYFGMIHFLYEHLSPYSHDMGLNPGAPLKVRDIQNSVKRSFGVKPHLQGGSAKGGKVHVKEFWYSLTDHLKFVDNFLNVDYSGPIKSLDDLVIVPE